MFIGDRNLHDSTKHAFFLEMNPTNGVCKHKLISFFQVEKVIIYLHLAINSSHPTSIA